MKQIGSLLCIGVFFWILVALPTSADSAEQTIAVIWEGRARNADDLLLGFMSNWKEVAPGIKVELRRNFINMEAAEKAFHELEPKVAGIVFLRSSGATFLANADCKIPCFVGGCNNPTELGAVKNLAPPEGKITGVTHFVPFDIRIKIISRLFPKVKGVALLLEEGHPGTPIDNEGTRSSAGD